MNDMNNRDNEYIPAAEDEVCCECDDCCEEDISPVQAMFERYCDNLVFPDEEKCIAPKKLYITLGAAFAGAVALFLLIGWLLCYCPLNTTGFSAKDFIAEYNSIVLEGDVDRQTIDATVNVVTASASDIRVAYPDFSDLLIPEDANLEKGVALCGGKTLINAELVGGKIQKLTIAVNEESGVYNPRTYSFFPAENVDFDYSALPHYAAAGKGRLAFYNMVRRQQGMDVPEYTLSDAISYCMGMLQGAIYSFADADDYDPNQSYFEYTDNLTLYFTPENFCFTADSRETALMGSDNGLYRFFDSIFGGWKDKDESSNTVSDSDEVTTGTDVSAADVSSADVSAADAE